MANTITNSKPTVLETNDALTIELPWAVSLEFAAELLAEGDHCFSRELSRTAIAIIIWPGLDCPWFEAHPTHMAHYGHEVASFIIEEYV